MARHRGLAFCKAPGCEQPPRRIKHAQFCSPCWRKKGSPKRACSVCSVEFSTDVMLGRRCRPCASNAAHDRRVSVTYSLTPEMYQELLAAQQGRCFICRRKPGKKRLSVDHDHSCCPGPVSCGRCVRGLLCKADNRDVLGHLRDDVEALERAIDYLSNPPARRLWGAR